MRGEQCIARGRGINGAEQLTATDRLALTDVQSLDSARRRKAQRYGIGALNGTCITVALRGQGLTGGRRLHADGFLTYRRLLVMTTGQQQRSQGQSH